MIFSKYAVFSFCSTKPVRSLQKGGEISKNHILLKVKITLFLFFYINVEVIGDLFREFEKNPFWDSPWKIDLK